MAPLERLLIAAPFLIVYLVMIFVWWRRRRRRKERRLRSEQSIRAYLDGVIKRDVQ